MTTTLRNFIFSVILFSLTGGNLLAQAPSKTSPRPQDYVPSSKVISSRNGEFDKQSGIPRSLWNINAGPYNGTHEQIAQQFLRENTSLLHLRNELSDISMERTQTNFGISHVTFHQNLNGVPVFRSDVVVSVNAENYVTFVVNNYKPNVNLSTIPSLSKQTALTLAKEFLQLRGKTIDEPTSELMVYAEGEPPALCYRISIFNEDPLGDWEVFVDALNGSIISSTDRAVYEKPKENSQKKSQGTGYIFDPDPLQSAQQFYNTTGYVDGNDADTPELTAQRKLVTLKDITFSSGTYKLQGPFCKLLDFESPTDIFANPTEPDSFRFTRFQQGFEEVMVYFWIDSSQRYIQSLGFDNIQNLPIECDPHGLSGADNSHYIPSSNRLAWGEGGSDDDEDLDVIWHEYGHAIHYGI
ncbi:MAG: hypothetical protein KGZ58_05770, partial [Ignavibacteriales bacterium]|nr:hypothetical protein [Ignavibacteriales bacterium]